MSLQGIEEAIIGVVESATPSVVAVSVTQLARVAPRRAYPVEGMGSGVIVRSDGILVTNHHVVRSAREVRVRLASGRVVAAEVLTSDAGLDLAVLRVAADDLPAARLGDSDKLRVGQLAIAIGSPFGMFLEGPSVTTGVVSALRRSLAMSDGGEASAIEDLIQTDAPINPGNSGGPLLDSSGAVIGINTAMISRAQGIGFAIPSNLVASVVEQVLATGKIARPWLGIRGASVTAEVRDEHALAVDAGALVFGVEPRSPAALAGLAEGDVIVALDGARVDRMEDLRSRLKRRRPGERLALGVVRGRDRATLQVTVREKAAGP
ncbi:MAG: S1C family serine protease [Thermoplasmatota archaeon]